MTSSEPPRSEARLLRISELAAHLGVTKAQIYRLSAAGRIPRYKAGHRTVRYDLDEVLAALRSAPPEPEAPRQPRPPASLGAGPPLRDLPAYDWSPSTPIDGTLPPAERRG